jgi:hypothetical protein
MSFGFSDHALVPVAILPVQFQLSSMQSRAISPARGLALAVLEQAVTDVNDQRFARTRFGQRVYWETYHNSDRAPRLMVEPQLESTAQSLLRRKSVSF